MLNYLWDPAISLPGYVCNGVDNTPNHIPLLFYKITRFCFLFFVETTPRCFSIFLEIIVCFPFVEKLVLTRLHKES